MLTGDSSATAIAIAKECGILNENWTKQEADYSVLEGHEFRKLIGDLQLSGDEPTKSVTKAKLQNLQKFKGIAAELKVLARSTPEDKFMLVTGLI